MAMSKVKTKTLGSDHRTQVGVQRRKKTEALIIRAALNVFAEKGRDGAVIDDVLVAADISRGTFYNYFDSVEQLLERTSRWMVEDLIANFIEPLLIMQVDPAERLCTGLRLFFQRAEADREWCRFIGRIWTIGPLDAPSKDIRRGMRLKIFTVPSFDAALTMQRGTIREALLRIATGDIPKRYSDQITEVIMQGLGVGKLRIAEIMSKPLPVIKQRAS